MLKKQQWSEARLALQALCRMTPEDHGAWRDLGEVCAALGDMAGAEQAWQRALALQAELPQVHLHLARLYTAGGRWAQAEPHLRACLQHNPADTEALAKLALTLEAQGRLGEAEALYRRELAVDADRVAATLGLGRVVRGLGRREEAEALIDQVLASAPDMAMAHFEKGQLLRLGGQYGAALEAFQRFHQLAPAERETYLLNCADLYAEQEQYEAALGCYDEAVSAFPRSAYAHWGRALVLLKLGRYEQGWAAFEWRRGYPDWQRQCGRYAELTPQWRGEPLAGKKVLVFAEQGFGDTIQFGRYLPQLVAQGAEVTFHCQPALLPLFRRMAGIMVVARDTGQTNGFDACLPVMSLAAYFGARSDRVNGDLPYLCADAEKTARWREKLAGDGLKVGLVWAGAAINPVNRRRSFELATYAPLKAVPGVRLYSLQKGEAAADKQSAAWQGVVDLSEEMADFDDTAAIIANLDLVITADTAVAHLAGAMGRPVWVLVYADPDWRWQAEVEGRNVWYPGAVLFRQRLGEPWSAVVARVADRLLSGP